MGESGEKFDKWKLEEKFHPPESLERSRSKRVKELEVLLGEMESLSKGARIYEGTTGAPGAVFLLAGDRTAAKSAVKKARVLSVPLANPSSANARIACQ